ncbi:MAG: hypothetical protein QXM75_02730, partial [Candidatus Diapherotrites archaeon]
LSPTPSPTPIPTSSPVPPLSPTQTVTNPSPQSPVRPTVLAIYSNNFYLIRNQNNTITAIITDFDGDADLNGVFISAKSPSNANYYKIYQNKMSCSGSGLYLTCTVIITPDSTWANNALVEVIARDKIAFGNPGQQLFTVTGSSATPSPPITPILSPTPVPTPEHSPSPVTSPVPSPTPSPTLCPTPIPTITPSVTPTPTTTSRPEVSIFLDYLIINQSNTIKATVTDPDGDIDANNVLLSIKSSSSMALIISNQKMSCTGTGFSISCSYDVTPTSAWGSDAIIEIVAKDSIDYGEKAYKNVSLKFGTYNKPKIEVVDANLKKLEINSIIVNILDQENMLDVYSVYVSAKSPPSDTGFRIYEERMKCSGTASSLTCTYIFYIDEKWSSEALFRVFISDSRGITSYERTFKVIDNKTSISTYSSPIQTVSPMVSPTTPSSVSKDELEIYFEYPKEGLNELPVEKIDHIVIRVTVNGKPLDKSALSASVYFNGLRENGQFLKESSGIYKMKLSNPISEGTFSLKVFVQGAGMSGEKTANVTFKSTSTGLLAIVTNWIIILLLVCIVFFLAYFLYKKYKEKNKPNEPYLQFTSQNLKKFPEIVKKPQDEEIVTPKKFKEIIGMYKEANVKSEKKQDITPAREEKAKEIISELKKKLK